MRHTQIRSVGISLIALVLAACGGAATPTLLPEASEDVAEIIPPTESPPTATTEQTEEATDAPTEIPTATPTEAPTLVPAAHREAPAPRARFVADSPEWIGNTGNPQLVEFFAFW